MPPRPPRSAHTQKHTAPAHTLRTPVARLRTQKNTSPQTHTQVQKPQSITRPRAPRALLPIFIAGICIAGVFAASPVFFPTNPPASLTPDDTTASGTLGYALSFFDSDGTAPNTEKLGGTPASEFLQVHPSCGAGEVWKGIGTSGKPLCGFVTTPLVMEMRLLSGSIRLNGTERKAPYSFSAQGTDRIETGKDRATLQFVADASLLRLDKQTSITLGYGANSDGQTVAQTVLERGVLWGRVLTGTGMNFGHWGFVAWVRGTGIKFGIREDGKLTVAVPHSRSQGFKTLPGMGDVTAALDMTCKNANGAPKSLGLLLGDERVYDTANCSEITPQKKSGIQTLYDTDRWIAENVIEDIMYINSILADAQAHDTKKQAATAEKTITIPTTPAEKNALCAAGETYWEQFENSATIPVCSKTLAYVDFSAEAGVNRGKMILLQAGWNFTEHTNNQYRILTAVPVPADFRPSLTSTSTIRLRDNGFIMDKNCDGRLYGDTDDNKFNRLFTMQELKDFYSLVGREDSQWWRYLPWLLDQINWLQSKWVDAIIFYKKSQYGRCDDGGWETVNYDVTTYKSEGIDESDGIKITGGKRIYYNLSDFASIGGLWGKTIEIEFKDMNYLNQAITSESIKNLIDINNIPGEIIRYYVTFWNGEIQCNTKKGTSPVGFAACNDVISDNTIRITIPQNINTSAGTLYIGNNQVGTRPVDTIIKAVRILQ